MSGFTGFPDNAEEASNPGINKQGHGNSRRQKEKLLMAAANQKTRSVVGCSGDVLPPEARLSTPAPVKLKVSGEQRSVINVENLKLF